MKVLVAFGTRYGSTAEVASTLAETFKTRGMEVTLADLKQKTPIDVDEFDLIVFGSSIIVGSWTKEAQLFITENLEKLNKKHVAVFVCCGDTVFGRFDEAQCHQMYITDLVQKFNMSAPVSSTILGGYFDFRSYGFLVKSILQAKGLPKQLRSQGIDLDKPYDFRKFDAARDWAISLIE